MKKQLLFFIALFGFMTVTFAQSGDCEKTCLVDKIVHEGAFLGVQFGSPCDKESKTDKGVIILKIVPKTAAEDNDFQPYDVVLKVDEIEVNRRGDAMKLVSSYMPFDVVTFTISRKGQTIIKKVTLGARTTKIVQEKVCCEETLSILNKDNISVFPSPAVVNLNVSFKTVVQDEYKFSIYMSNGVLVKEYSKKLDSGSLKEIIPVDKLQDGVYILKITNRDSAFSKLFAVSRD